MEDQTKPSAPDPSRASEPHPKLLDFIRELRQKAENAKTELQNVDLERARELPTLVTQAQELEDYFGSNPFGKISEPVDAGETTGSGMEGARARFQRLVEPISQLRKLLRVLLRVEKLVGSQDDQQHKAIKEANRALREFESHILSIPDELADRIFGQLAGFDPESMPDALLAAKAALKATSEEQRLEALYFIAMLTTDDIVGIVLRGHIFIEGAIEKLIAAYAASDVDLFEDMGLFFEAKLYLAYLMGLITADELKITKSVNGLRNKIAHYKTLSYKLDSSKVNELWKEFISLQSFRSRYWPSYDPDRFTEFLIYILVHLYIIFERRSEDISNRKLPQLAVEMESVGGELSRSARVTVTQFLIRAARATIKPDEMHDKSPKPEG